MRAQPVERATAGAAAADNEAAPPPLTARLAALNWARIGADLDAYGCAATGTLLSEAQCAALRKMYALEQPFRSRVTMARHGFGRGEYKYFGYPLPPVVASLRAGLYPQLAEIANRWSM